MKLSIFFRDGQRIPDGDRGTPRGGRTRIYQPALDVMGGMAVSRWLITRFVFSRPIRNKYVNILGYAAHFAWVALFIWQGGMVALGIAVEWWHMSRSCSSARESFAQPPDGDQ